MSKKLRLIIFIMINLVCLSGCDKVDFSGNGISYIQDKKKNTFLNIYNQDKDETYQKEIGKKDKIFWALHNINEDEALIATNMDIVYLITESGIEEKDNLGKNIVGLVKCKNKYAIVSQIENSYSVVIWDDKFENILCSQDYNGEFSHIAIGESGVLFSSFDTNEGTTIVQQYNENNNVFTNILKLNTCADIVPFEYDDNFYLGYNYNLVNTKKEYIHSINRIINVKKTEKVCDTDDDLKKVLCTDNALYTLCGTNDTIISKLDMNGGICQELFSLSSESALGLYHYRGMVIVITGKGIYEVGSTLNRLTTINSMLINVYQ